MMRLRIGLIGAGFMGKAHSAAYATMQMHVWPPAAVPELAVVADQDAAAAASGAARFGFRELTDDWRELVRRDDIDVIDICTPPDSHREIALEAIRHGKHVLVEKPIALNGEEAREMFEAAEAARVKHLVGFSYRRTPAVLYARQLIDDGVIGRLYSFRGCYLQDWCVDPQAPRTWRHVASIAGSGTLGDIGSHIIDIARMMMGDVDSVVSMVKTWVDERPLDTSPKATRGPVTVDDEVMFLCRFREGALGRIEASRFAHGRNNFLGFEINGERGSISFNYEEHDQARPVCRRRAGGAARLPHDQYRAAPSLWQAPLADPGARHWLHGDQDHRNRRLLQFHHRGSRRQPELPRRLAREPDRRRGPAVGRQERVGDGGMTEGAAMLSVEEGDALTAGTLLSLRDIRKAFGPVVALNGVDLDVGFGEVVALVGDNGAGKSTLIKIVSGVLLPDTGTISVEGRQVRFSGPDGPKSLGIETVYQDLALISVFDTVQNLYLGREMKRFGGMLLDHRGMARDARKHLTGLSIQLPSLKEKVRHLSGGQRQAVAISRATGWGAKLIIMDEPTAALGVREGRQVLDLVKSLRAAGVSIILISHNVEHVFDVSDRIVVLRHGRRVASLTTAETTHEEVVKFITGAASAARVSRARDGPREAADGAARHV